MLAQGAKYQKRASFTTNDAARGKTFVQKHLLFFSNTNDTMKSAAVRGQHSITVDDLCRRSIPTGPGELKIPTFLSFKFSKKFLREDRLATILCHPDKFFLELVKSHGRKLVTYIWIRLLFAISYQKLARFARSLLIMSWPQISQIYPTLLKLWDEYEPPGGGKRCGTSNVNPRLAPVSHPLLNDEYVGRARITMSPFMSPSFFVIDFRAITMLLL